MVTFSAAGPFWPATTSKETFWPSLRVLNPSPGTVAQAGICVLPDTRYEIRIAEPTMGANGHTKRKVVVFGTKPDGTPRKLLDVSRLHALGWMHRIELSDGIAETYDWFLREQTATSEMSPEVARAVGI